ncbi:MAG: AAA family ATPase [Gammaproteobacteria bacterium]
MKAVEISIHNFRSICDANIRFENCGVLVGTNNAGKTTVIDSIRAFYGKGVKFNPDKDFPHIGMEDDECWVEIEFLPTQEELENLKEEYQSESSTFRVRNYLYSKVKDKEGKDRSGPYAYINGVLSEDRFYGFKNVAQSKFGQIIYIPAVSKVDEHTKLTGPSALRDLLTVVLSKVMAGSEAYKGLNDSFQQFEEAIKSEATEDGFSLETIEQDISSELEQWEADFILNINPIGVDDLLKGLVSHQIIDKALETPQSISSYGQGFQRSVIYTLIRIAAKYSSTKSPKKKKEFSPDLTWILFEEPEAFLHPTQISILNAELRAWCQTESSQVLLSTHNPLLATHSIQNLPAICRLQRINSQTSAYQINQTDLDQILAVNQLDAQKWADSGLQISADDLLLDMEAVKYALWLDSKRCAAFFSEKVLMVEGPSETALLSYMYDEGLLPGCKGVFFLDTIGKYNMHRFMRLFEVYGIKHYVLFDEDNGRNQIVSDTIRESSNTFTGGIDSFESDIEGFLGIPNAGRPHRKPQHIMYRISQDNVKLEPLAEKIEALVGR